MHGYQHYGGNCCLHLQNIFHPEAGGSRFLWIIYWTTQHRVSEDHGLSIHCCENRNLLVHGFMLWNVKNNLKHKYWSLYFHPSHISSDLVFTVTLHSPHICNSLPPFRLWMSWHFTNSGHWTQYSQSISQRSILRLSSHLVSLPSGLPTKILHALHVCSFRLHV